MHRIWQKNYGNCQGITIHWHIEPWPEFNDEYLKEDTFNYPVSFNGKMRFNIELPVDMTKEEIIQNVLADERAKKWIGNGTPSNIIVVPNRIINISNQIIIDRLVDVL